MVTQRVYTGYMETERPKQSSVTVRFPSDVIDEMRKLAHADDRSLNSEIVRALREFIERRQQQASEQQMRMAG